ncbi:MAG TPA: hypothetical protein VK629_22210, partial [Steroidobacteraceae bacterium]|nr:hypothetical protein [Steroidobacteraceae bacterium]
MSSLRCAVAVGAVGLSGCAGQPATSTDKFITTPTTPRDPAWGVTIASQAELDHDRDCGRGALQTAYAL